MIETTDIILFVENVDVLSHYIYEFLVPSVIIIHATWDVISTECEVNYLTCISTAPLYEEPENSCM